MHQPIDQVEEAVSLEEVFEEYSLIDEIIYLSDLDYPAAVVVWGWLTGKVSRMEASVVAESRGYDLDAFKVVLH